MDSVKRCLSSVYLFFAYGLVVPLTLKSFSTMKHLICCCLLSLASLSGYAQTGTPVPLPKNAVSQLEDVKELTKTVAVAKDKARMQAEARPEVNRLLVLAADDFVRVAKSGKPTQEAYITCLDAGLARLAPLTTTPQDRQQVAEYFQELMEIVGMKSSEGRLSAFASIK